MTAKTELSAPKRRTRAEVQQLVTEFVNSGMRRSEFCQSRGLSFSTLDRHLKKLRWKRRRKPISSAGRLVPVDGLGPATRIYLAAGVTDMRKGFEGLYGLVRDRATMLRAP